MSTTAAKLTKTERLRAALQAIIPGEYRESLSDQVCYGPRGGIQGLERNHDAFNPGVAWVSKVVGSNSGIRHGRHRYFIPGFIGKRAKVQTGGVTLPDTPEVHAILREFGVD